MKQFFSKAGQAFMLPIALLPVAGILLGIGGSFTNQAMIESYGLTFLEQGTILNSALIVLKNAGDIVFANLPLLFAVGLTVGFARKEKGGAALAAVIGYLIMNTVIATTLQLTGYDGIGQGGLNLHEVSGSLTSVLGVENTLSMGVFGGIISGLVTSILHNKFIDAKLPDVLGFFGGPRLIPILASFAAIIYGMIFAIIWPSIGQGLAAVGDHILQLGAVGSLLFGLIERALIPFGLHHVFYTPLWQTSVGGCITSGAGELICGTQNQFFYYLSQGNLEMFTATNFMSGKFPFMIFGLPGAALAMYHTAKSENKKVVGGLLLSIAFTSMLTGITEPIEFTFLFLAPMLYFLIHVPLAGISFMLMDLLQVKVGMTFSGGFIDYALFGILPQATGQNVNALWIVIVGLVYFVIYYLVFRFVITKFNILTPGRGNDNTIKTKKDYKAKKEQEANGTANENELELAMIEALGGKDNIKDVDACITRLRVSVNDASLVKDNEYWINELGAKGLVVQGNGIQAIYGAQAKVHKGIIAEILGLE